MSRYILAVLENKNKGKLLALNNELTIQMAPPAPATYSLSIPRAQILCMMYLYSTHEFSKPKTVQQTISIRFLEYLFGWREQAAHDLWRRRTGPRAGQIVDNKTTSAPEHLLGAVGEAWFPDVVAVFG